MGWVERGIYVVWMVVSALMLVLPVLFIADPPSPDRLVTNRHAWRGPRVVVARSSRGYMAIMAFGLLSYVVSVFQMLEFIV